MDQEYIDVGFIVNLFNEKEMNIIKYQHAFHIDFPWIYVDINKRFYFLVQHMYHHSYKD